MPQLAANRLAELAPLPPGNMGLPIIGESLAYWRDRDFVAKRQERFGPTFKSSLFGHSVVFLLGRDANRFVLSTSADAFSSAGGYPGTMASLFGNRAPFLLDGAEHRDMRQLWSGLFSSRALETALPKLNSICAQHGSRWHKNEPADWQLAFRHLTMEIMITLLFEQALSKSTHELCQLSAAVSRSMSPFLPLHWRRLRWRQALVARDQLVSQIELGLNERTTDFQKKLLVDFQANRRDVANHLLFLLFAGHETVSNMLYSVRSQLMRDESLRSQIVDEVSELKAPVKLNQLTQLDLMTRFLWEIERLCPTINGLFRGVKQTIEWDGYQIPAGWLVCFRTQETHRDPGIYPEPCRFDLGRFAKQKPDKFGLIGFGGGAHTCPGKSMAHVIMKLTLIQLIKLDAN